MTARDDEGDVVGLRGPAELLNACLDSGQQFVITGEVKDSAQPFRVTLAWTDAPGFSGAAPWVNDLDLEVTINGQVYRGILFARWVRRFGHSIGANHQEVSGI